MLLFLAPGCGGGGGGEGGAVGSSGAVQSSDGGGEGIALRVLHGSIDAPPLIVNLDGSEFERVSYNLETGYRGVSAGGHQLSVFIDSETPQLLTEVAATFQEGKEYTLLLSGRTRNGQLSARVFEETPVKPAEGSASAQIFNAFESSGAVSLEFGGASSEGVSPGGKSDLFTIPAVSYTHLTLPTTPYV